MRRFAALANLVVGLFFLFWGLPESDPVASEIAEFLSGAPSDDSVRLIAFGVLGMLLGAGSPLAVSKRGHRPSGAVPGSSRSCPSSLRRSGGRISDIGRA